jgi:hypothetical protein
MTFLSGSAAPLQPARLQADPLATWRNAELLVQLRRDDLLAAGRGSRREAFAAYGVALDAEARAAGELADAYSDLAEAA